MTLQDLAPKSWLGVIGTVLIVLLALALGQTEFQRTEFATPTPFFQSALGTLLIVGSHLTGLFLLGLKRPGGWNWIGISLLFLSQSFKGPATLITMGLAALCLLAKNHWKSVNFPENTK
jgi:hypothetical protein